MNEWSANCLRCGYAFDTYTSVTPGGGRPDTGAVSLCLECGHLAIFVNSTFGLALRETTADEHDALMADPDIIKVLAARQVVMDR